MNTVEDKRKTLSDKERIEIQKHKLEVFSLLAYRRPNYTDDAFKAMKSLYYNILNAAHDRNYLPFGKWLDENRKGMQDIIDNDRGLYCLACLEIEGLYWSDFMYHLLEAGNDGMETTPIFELFGLETEEEKPNAPISD